MPPGSYGLQARRNGFVYLQDENKDARDLRITLKAGDAVTDRIVEMTPAAVITGRVVDDYGDPVERASVRASAVGSDSSSSFVLSRMNALTDERGQFRIVGARRKFHIAATKLSEQLGVHEIRSDGSEIPVYAETWYPASESQDRAGVVEAVAGRETAGIDIRLTRKRSLTLGGVVTGIPEGSARAQVFVQTRSRGFPSATADEDGKFAFSGVAPDHYHVTARHEAADLQTVRDDRGKAREAGFTTRFTKAKQHGSYSFSNLPPGSYKLVAVPGDDADLLTQTSGLADYEDLMDSAEIHAGAPESMDLELRTPGN